MCQPMSLMDQHIPAQTAIGKQDHGTFTLSQATPAMALHTDVAFASVRVGMSASAWHCPDLGLTSAPCRFPPSLLKTNEEPAEKDC